MPYPPGPMSPRDWRTARRDWRRMQRRDREGFNDRPIEERITIFRRNLVSTGWVVGMLATINFVTSPHFPWFLFASIGMGASVVRQWSSLWAEGVTWRRIFRRDARALREGQAPTPALPPASAAEEEAAKMVPREVLLGRHGEAVRRAARDRLAILAIVDSLAPADRELLPDVVPTVNALAERAASLAQMLHHLDADITPDSLAQLEARIADVKREPEGAADRDRRLALLERQYASLQELATRRTRIFGQLESAGIALQNLKLDLLKLRSSGVQSALNEVNSATVEARALSRDIAHVLEAADEVRRL
ncbi:MAG: 2TM domain-containing protein [Gemmatimonadaceae bacterium]|nr:2TM domain-containing protein [Gemmatimonadaceae bacterium]